MSTSSPSNLSDAEWACLQRYLPTVPKRGRPPIHPLRIIFDAVFSVLRTGWTFRYPPANFPRLSNGVLPLSPFARSPAPGAGLLMVLREAERERVGRNAQRSRAIMDAASASKRLRKLPGSVARDAHTCVKGRTRHILVDTLGLLLAVYVTPAALHDGKGARCLLAGLAPLYSLLTKIWADAAYRGQEVAVWCQAEGGWELEVVEREPGTRGFSILPRRWVVERTFRWISRAEKHEQRRRAKGACPAKHSSRWQWCACSSLVWRGIYEPVPTHPHSGVSRFQWPSETTETSPSITVMAV